MPDGSGRAYAYDAQGNLTGQTDALGNTTVYTYDPATGFLESVTDPLNTALRIDSWGG